MPVTQSASAPYAPTTAILSLIDRHRQRGLPVPVTTEVLGRASIPESLAERTLSALKSLDLLDDEGKPTLVFEGLRLAPETEYKNKKADWLRAAYADALKFVDPATVTHEQLHDAFRSYNPPGQRRRMVTLFMGLFQDAGVMPEQKRRRSASASPKNGDTPTRRTKLAERSSTPDKPSPTPPGDFTASKQLDGVVSQLLAKFPTFDPAWGPDIQAKWFEGYERLLSMGGIK